jgi:myo-inositol-1(or 4)-monophosphatase
MFKMSDGEDIINPLMDFVCELTEYYSRILIKKAVSGDRMEIQNLKHQDNFLSDIDLELDERYRKKLSRIIPEFIYVSEEGNIEYFPRRSQEIADLIIIVDPLDTSELAVRGLYGHTHLMVYSLERQAPIASIVGNFFHQVQLFVAFRNRSNQDVAFLKTRDGEILPMRSSQETNLNRALVTNYMMRPHERFQKLAEQHKLLDELGTPDETGMKRGRVGVDFGSVGLCHVAAGFTDAMIELAKGFALWDLMPGHYILHAAGGIIVDPNGNDISLRLELDNINDLYEILEGRQLFIAAGNTHLIQSILETIIHG